MRSHWLVKRSRPGMFETCYLGGVMDFYDGASYSHGEKLHPGGGEPLRLWQEGWRVGRRHWRRDLRRSRQLGNYAAWPKELPYREIARKGKVGP